MNLVQVLIQTKIFRFGLIFVYTLLSVSPTVTIDGPLSVWNGQSGIASITNDAGEWPHGDQGGLLENMFDGNLDTFWHSSGTTVNDPKTIKIEFKVTKTMIHSL